LKPFPAVNKSVVTMVKSIKNKLCVALCELAHDGKVVYHGHLGHELLPGIGHVLKVLLRIVADKNAFPCRATCAAASYYRSNRR